MGNSQERWDGRGGYWTEYSDWLFYSFIIQNCNQILRKDIRKTITEEIDSTVCSDCLHVLTFTCSHHLVSEEFSHTHRVLPSIGSLHLMDHHIRGLQGHQALHLTTISCELIKLLTNFEFDL